MSLPTLEDLVGLDVGFLGQPFVEGSVSSTMDDVELAFLAEPFTRNEASPSGGGPATNFMLLGVG